MTLLLVAVVGVIVGLIGAMYLHERRVTLRRREARSVRRRAFRQRRIDFARRER